MTRPDEILAIARNELGTVEARDGSNKYGRAYGMDRVAWCMQFVWWCFREAGASGLIHPKTAYTPTAAQWHKDRGAFDQNPRVGDLVFFNWPDSINRVQHVGIVEAVEPSAVLTIEGNTSTTNQSDGGRVMRRRRARNSSIVGYGHPAYLTPSPKPRAAVAPSPKPRPAPRPPVRKDDEVYIRHQPDPTRPDIWTALLVGPFFIGLNANEARSADGEIARGATCQWVERGTWDDLDRRSKAIARITPTAPGAK